MDVIRDRLSIRICTCRPDLIFYHGNRIAKAIYLDVAIRDVVCALELSFQHDNAVSNQDRPKL